MELISQAFRQEEVEAVKDICRLPISYFSIVSHAREYSTLLSSQKHVLLKVAFSFNPYPATKVFELGLWKGYSYLSTLFPSFRWIYFTPTNVMDPRTGWLLAQKSWSRDYHTIASPATNRCSLHIHKKKKTIRDYVAIAGKNWQLAMIRLPFVYIYHRKFVWLAQEPICSDTKLTMMKFYCDFGDLFHQLILNTDKRRFVIKYIPFSVGQPITKEWALFLEELRYS